MTKQSKVRYILTPPPIRLSFLVQLTGDCNRVGIDFQHGIEDAIYLVDARQVCFH